MALPVTPVPDSESGKPGVVSVANSSGTTVDPATEATLANIDTDLGAAADAEATGNGSVIALLKRLRTLLNGGLPAALTAGGNLKAAILEALPAGTNSLGKITVEAYSDTNPTRGDGVSNTAPALPTVVGHARVDVFPYLLNEGAGTWDRERGNYEETLLAQAARTATTSVSFTNRNARGVVLKLRIEGAAASETLTIEVKYSADIDSDTVASLTTAAGGTGRYTLTVCPGASGSPDNPSKNKSVALALPRSAKVTITHSGAGSWTYSLLAAHIN